MAIPTGVNKKYVEWIEGAKKPETRANRIKKAVEKLCRRQKTLIASFASGVYVTHGLPR